MNNQIELTIIPDDASDTYDLSSIIETADSIYWTLELPFNVNNYRVLITDTDK